MAEHIWTVLCERHLADSDTGLISLMDLTESLTVEGLEQKMEEAARLGKKGSLVNARAQLVSWWFRSDPGEETFQARFVLLSPDGKELLAQPVNSTWGGDKQFTMIFVNMKQIPVSMPGLYWFVVEQQRTTKSGKFQWARVTRLPLHIDKD